MKFRNALILKIIVACLFSKVKGQTNCSPAPLSDKEMIDSIELQWVKSYVTRDIPYLDSLWNDDVKFISTKGEPTGKKSEIDEMRSNVVKYNSFETFDVSPVFYGKTAVVTSKSHINATINSSGKVIDIKVTALDIFIKINGRWKLVASQLTRLN